MPLIPAEDIEKMVYDAVNHAAAPQGSQRWQNTPDAIRPLHENGDVGDAWVFLSGCVQLIIGMLNLDQCTCGQHHQVLFAFAPIGPDGKPMLDLAVTPNEDGDYEDVPESIKEQAPAAFYLAKIITAQIAKDSERSLDVWAEVHEHGLTMSVIALAVKQAGDVRREYLAAQAVN